jgi:hypothetical protein
VAFGRVIDVEFGLCAMCERIDPDVSMCKFPAMERAKGIDSHLLLGFTGCLLEISIKGALFPWSCLF